MRKSSLIAVAVVSLGLCGCGQLVKVASQGGEAAVKAGGQAVAEAGQAASKAAGEAGQHMQKAGQELGQAGQELGRAGHEIGQSVENASRAGVDVATELLTSAGDLFSATSDQITDWSVEKQSEFEKTTGELKGQFETIRTTLSPEAAADLDNRFKRLDDRLKESATGASVAGLQAVQQEGSELVAKLKELQPTQTSPATSGNPAAVETPAPTPAEPNG